MHARITQIALILPEWVLVEYAFLKSQMVIAPQFASTVFSLVQQEVLASIQGLEGSAVLHVYLPTIVAPVIVAIFCLVRFVYPSKSLDSGRFFEEPMDESKNNRG